MQLRMATAEDAAAVRRIYAPIIETSATSFEVVVPSVDEMAARILDRQPVYPWLVAIDDATVDGEVMGYAYAGAFAPRAAYGWSVETSVYLADQARGRGVGRALYVALFGLLETQGYRQAMAGITLPNAASVALHERAGFRSTGVYRAVGWKFDVWHDVGWWQRPIGAPDAPVRAPTPFTELADGVLEAALSVRS